MKRLALLAALFALVLAGCKKEAEPTGDAAVAPPKGATADTSTSENGKNGETDATTATAGFTKDQLVGKWSTSRSEDGDMKMEMAMTIDVKADGTYVMNGSGSFDGDTGGVKISGKMKVQQTGTWKLEGDEWTSTPGESDAKVEDLAISASDPAMQAEVAKMKDQMKSQIEGGFAESVKDEHKSKIKSLGGNEMVTEEKEGHTLTWKRA